MQPGAGHAGSMEQREVQQAAQGHTARTGGPRIQSQFCSQPPDNQMPEVDFETEVALKSRLLSQGPLSRDWRKTPSFHLDPKNVSPLLWLTVA